MENSLQSPSGRERHRQFAVPEAAAGAEDMPDVSLGRLWKACVYSDDSQKRLDAPMH